MKVRFGEDLGVADETCVEICTERCEMGKGVAGTRIAANEELPADLEAAEACSTETIIQTWRQLRSDLLSPSASKNSLLIVR